MNNNVISIGPPPPGQTLLPWRAAGMNAAAINPFGQLLAPISSTSAVSEYRYGGKEWSEVTLSYDFGARNYLPSIPRWTTMDPLAEKYYSTSPYVYCAGNPVNLVDEEGKDSYSVNKKGGIVKIDDEGGEKVELRGIIMFTFHHLIRYFM